MTEDWIARCDLPHQSDQPRSVEADPGVDWREESVRTRFTELLSLGAIPDSHMVKNLPLYLRRDVLADILAVNSLYRRLLHVPGVIMEFGVQWGRRLALLVALRELYEPRNFTRRVIGFDTFSGFPAVDHRDGGHTHVRPGGFAVSSGYDAHLEAVLEAHEEDGALGHMRRFELRSGDVRDTLPLYLDENPETVVGLAYFDLDLYAPTKACLELITPRLVKGSILAFDQFGQAAFPGETLAVLEAIDLAGRRFECFDYHPYPVFLVV